MFLRFGICELAGLGVVWGLESRGFYQGSMAFKRLLNGLHKAVTGVPGGSPGVLEGDEGLPIVSIVVLF